MLDRATMYDLAVSFAGAQRPLVERYVRACEALGPVVFYDRNVTTRVWGHNFIYEFRKVYGGRARYVVPFISSEYLAGSYPMDEFNAAVARSIERPDDPYLLPILVGDVEVPEELISSAVAYLEAGGYTVEELAEITADRVRGATRVDGGVENAQPASVGLPQVRLPKIAPLGFSPYRTLEVTLTRVGARFTDAASQLEPFGYLCRVRVTETAVDVRVERSGEQICGLRVWLDDTFGEDRIAMNFAWPRATGNAFNGWATAEWDNEAGEGRLRYVDFALVGNKQHDLLSADGFFDLLWQKIVDHIEQVGGRSA
ncbi:hypothetical protein Lesp02_13430 [Lentzea sp. NBRC 105346]|uniref:toll/interleukin-1 receptor domain-containing protein n=1 Tax=Lentzea sp. NBRC 105346 TaxID=3032205 RepID=UPI0024A45FD7|nr:toll/interleukin-1 receptor domain-containing protein [Lentzea sp. NBRC 105346]GLZ29153.1 hypothetical protein Lesp02_13430 [Lentzea sp. NBRC 105346]